jgi:hypothetical protein
MSYTYSWEIKSELDPRDFISWEMEEESDTDSDLDSVFISVDNFDEDEVL